MFRSGDKIGPYILIQKLGSGTFGVVWLAERKTKITTTQVAIKIPTDEEISLDAIKKEADVWVRASGHPNVLPIIEADIYDDCMIIVSEYASDGSLKDWLKANKEKSPLIEESVEIILGVLSGLEHLHARGINHRDVKPANILFQGNTPRLADFGISSILKSVNQSVNAVGTPAYMAPEAFYGQRDKQTDIWSVGVVLYQMLKGELPFTGNLVEIQAAIEGKSPAPLPDTIPFTLRTIILNKALAKDRLERYKAADDMKKRLNEFLSEHRRPVPLEEEEETRPIKKFQFNIDEKKNDGKADSPEPSPPEKLFPKKGRTSDPEPGSEKWNKWRLVSVILILILLVACGTYAILYFFTPGKERTPKGMKIPLSATKLIPVNDETREILKSNSNIEAAGSVSWGDASPEVLCHFIQTVRCKDIFKEKNIKSEFHFNKCSAIEDSTFIENSQNLYSIVNISLVRAENLNTPDKYKAAQNPRYEGTYVITADKYTVFESVNGRQSVEKEGSGLDENTFSVWYEENTVTKERKLFCDLCKKERVKFIDCDKAKYVIESIRQEHR